MVELNASFWESIKTGIKTRNSNNRLMHTWLEPIQFVEVRGTTDLPCLILGVPTPLHQYFVIENLNEQIYAEIGSVYHAPFEVDVVVTGVQVGGHHEENTLADGFSTYSENKFQPSLAGNISHQTSSSSSSQNSSLNSEYTFSTFVVGKNNEFAHAACFNIANNPGKGNNPLVICGPPGMGKTHLLHAVGNQIKNTQPGIRILYLTGELFLNECVSALRRNETEKFRAKYRDSADVLLVDDVQFIGKGQATQEEFFHMMNSYLDKKKQIVIASDRMPRELPGIEDRNRSRLEWGLLADITMPDIETRIAILRYKAEKHAMRLTEDVINHIARISKRSIRELEGNLRKVKMFSELQGLSIDIALAKRVLVNHETQASISIEDIQKMVAEYFKVRILDLKSTTRAKQIVVPRQISMYLIKRHLDKSLVDIGRAFGGKDHTTVMNAIERIEHLQTVDMDIKNDIEDLTTQIHNITGL